MPKSPELSEELDSGEVFEKIETVASIEVSTDDEATSWELLANGANGGIIGFIEAEWLNW
jgi:hypothetical protein